MLERPAYTALRSDPAFVAAWARWIEHCGTQGAKAREPNGPRAAAMLNEALQAGAARYVAAIDRAIARNWQGVSTEALAGPPAGLFGSRTSAGMTADERSRLMRQLRSGDAELEADARLELERHGERIPEVARAG